MSLRSLGHRAPLLWLVLPFIGGLVAGKVGLNLPPLGLLLGAVAGVAVAAWAVKRAPRLWAWAICLALLLAGAACYTLERQRLPAWDALPPREAHVSLRLDRVFPQADAKRVSGLATIMGASEPLRELAGQRVYFSLNLKKGEAPPIRSSVIAAVGVLASIPRDPPVDTFDGYLAGAGVNFRLKRGQLLAEEKPANAYYRFCARVSGQFMATLGLGIAEKRPALAGLLRAMMLGETHELSEEQHTLFMQSGTMHLFAISGLNIGVVAATLQAILALLRLPKVARFFLSVALLWLFVDITGTSPSAVRAFAMAVFFQAGFLLRLPSNPLAALVASAFVILLVAPLQVFSASFLMSYAIVAALLVLGLPMSEAWLEWWSPWRDLPQVTWRWWHHAGHWLWRTLAGALAIGLATTLVSLLTGVLFFQLLTPGSLVANLLLLPAAMIATLGGFLSLLCGLVGFVKGAVLFNHAAALVLLGIEGLVRLSVHLPGAFMPAQFTAPWVGPVALAALVAVLIAGYARQWHGWWRGYWAPFAVVALTLIFGVRFGAPEPKVTAMKSAYELAMERLAKSDPDASRPLTAEQKGRLAEIDRVYKGKLAEREIFLKKQLNDALVAQQADEVEKLQQQLASEKARIEEEREDEKERVRRGRA
ncbi:MAG: ComEC/Rec2 family competence protein [Verrucomicrobia bacterium]|nr:ComEC/Rec2 family competence protein [Verrucomicrobiota bacterium]